MYKITVPTKQCSEWLQSQNLLLIIGLFYESLALTSLSLSTFVWCSGRAVPSNLLCNVISAYRSGYERGFYLSRATHVGLVSISSGSIDFFPSGKAGRSQLFFDGALGTDSKDTSAANGTTTNTTSASTTTLGTVYCSDLLWRGGCPRILCERSSMDMQTIWTRQAGWCSGFDDLTRTIAT